MQRLTFVIILFFIYCSSASGATDSLVNPSTSSQEQPSAIYELGDTLLLPDGATTFIVEILRDGTLRTDNGYMISPEGVVLTGPAKGTRIMPLSPKIRETVLSDGQSPATNQEEGPRNAQDEQITLAQLLPLTGPDPDKEPQREKPARKSNIDLQYMQGVWVNETPLVGVKNHKPRRVTMSFKENGSGWVTTREPDTSYKGRVSCRANKNSVIVDLGVQRAVKGVETIPVEHIECKKVNEKIMQCYAVNEDAKYNVRYRRTK